MHRSIAITVIALAAACAGDKTATSDTAAAAAVVPAAVVPAAVVPAAVVPAATPAPAAVRIVSPADGDTTGADVTIVLGKDNVTIAKADGARVEGTGHHHLFLDTPPSPDGLPIPPTSATVIHIGTGDSTFTFKGLAPGAHEVIAVVGHGDHVPMATRRDTVRFVVKK